MNFHEFGKKESKLIAEKLDEFDTILYTNIDYETNNNLTAQVNQTLESPNYYDDDSDNGKIDISEFHSWNSSFLMLRISGENIYNKFNDGNENVSNSPTDEENIYDDGLVDINMYDKSGNLYDKEFDTIDPERCLKDDIINHKIETIIWPKIVNNIENLVYSVVDLSVNNGNKSDESESRKSEFEENDGNEIPA